MKNFNFLFLLIILSSLNSFGQKLTCADFKTGEFYIPTDNEGAAKFLVYKNDELIEEISEPIDSIKKYIVIRNLKSQIEWKNAIDFGDPTYENIEWIDDCTYRLTYDNAKNKKSEEDNWINENNGLLIKKIRIVDSCMEYSATLTLPDGIKIVQKSKICKK
ncbi:hypothetical protein SAMN04487764_2727 [Gillisia sp. Hel1_33_143]|uniref:hypothetical protein n=1 Tax=Gillisia sp. Hel1_33_143 TaxID=1336796 RepID=UPI00087D2399|nr:hypothetical protein [Gillisia sp. Hel1_33_143]SDS65489.1 hypothetical protein SAMN04487764_2727 [Gillisia sp. Hel1_33_143]